MLSLEKNFQNSSSALEILLLLVYSVFFIFLIYKLRFFEAPGISKCSISFIFTLKVIFGLLLWYIYTFYYPNRATADIYKYFDDGKIMFDALKNDPVHYFKMLFGIGNNTPEFDPYYSQMNYWAKKNDVGSYNDAHTVIRFNAFVYLFSFGYYMVHTVFICFISLIGFTAIYKAFVPFFENKKKELFFAVFLLPSVLFWGSGVLKEGLLFFTLGLLIYFFHQPFSWKVLCICFAAALLMAISKFYVWIALLPGLLYLLVLKITEKKNVALKFVGVSLLIILLGTNVDRFTNFQNPLVTLSQKQLEFNSLATGKNTDANNNSIPAAGSRIEIAPLQPTLFSLIKNAPAALCTVFLRPYPWEIKGAMMVPVGLENLLIIFFVFVCITNPLPLSVIRWEYVLFCLSFVIIQFIIIGETTPVLGAIARYKVPSLPFLLIAFLFVLDKQKLMDRVPLLKKL